MVDPPPDAGRPDAGRPDAGRPDAGDVDDPPDQGPDAGLDCEPLACYTANGEAAESPCAGQPQAACGDQTHRLCECGQRDRLFLFDANPGSGRGVGAVDYISQPGAGDGPDYRLGVGELCLVPDEDCAGLRACRSHRVVRWTLPERLVGAQVLTVFNHNGCGNRNRIVADIALVW
ncbi:MAG: hypothetical protein H6706_30450 [Myxococcales bacterium]|nr:hypothetical protein [Myxococcales bacterium]